MRTAGRGFTLVEIIFAAGLFVMLGLLLFVILKYGINAYYRGQLHTDVQHAVRDAIRQLPSDVQASMLLQLPIPDGDNAVQSAVLHPSVEASSSTDNLIFTAPAASRINTVNLSNAANYLLIRYAVHNHDPSNAADPPTAVYRRTYRYDEVLAAGTNIIVYSNDSAADSQSKTSNTTWCVNLSQLDSQLGGPGDNSKVGTSPNDTNWTEIVSFAGAYDLVTFTVSHVSLTGNPVASYDPLHFTVSVTGERYMGTPAYVTRAIGDPNDAANDRVVVTEQTEITLPRFQ